MGAIDEELADLIGRHVDRCALSAELAFLATQPTDKQALVGERLRVIDQYLSMVDPSVADVDVAASKAGVSRRQFYRLLTKVRSDGPVRGLLPGLQRVARSSAARDGLAEPIDALLINELRRDPEAKIARLASLVALKSEELGLEPPSEWRLRHRIHALRATGDVGAKVDFGSAMLIDQIALDLPVNDGARARYCVATLIIDRRTRLIAGAAMTVGDGIALGLQQALFDLSRRMAAFAERRFPVASKLKELTWVVAPGLDEVATPTSIGGESDNRDLEIEVIDNFSRRHGDRILRLLGDRLGAFSFRTRTELGIDAEIASGQGIRLEHAWKAVQDAVDAWNSKVTSNLASVEEAEVQKRTKRLSRLDAQLQSIFKPVLSSIEDRYRSKDLFSM